VLAFEGRLIWGTDADAVININVAVSHDLMTNPIGD